MIRIKEILDKGVDFKIIEDNAIQFQAVFTVNSIEYKFEAEVIKGDLDIYAIVFYIPYENTDRRRRVDITNSGFAFTVFSTVKDILLFFLKKYKPYGFFFTAKESSRIKLYNVFANNISKNTNYILTDSEKWLNYIIENNFYMILPDEKIYFFKDKHVTFSLIKEINKFFKKVYPEPTSCFLYKEYGNK